ncbi:unnamed protein product [Rotaria sp. Silwood1]|nr:unnamed protein product [Rotaria sp. Silwood1]
MASKIVHRSQINFNFLWYVMPKTDLGDVCGRYLSSRLSKQTNSSLSNDQQSIKHFLNHEYIATEHKRHTILNQKVFFKSYRKNPLDKLRQRYTITRNNNNNNNNNNSENINNLIMPANNDVLLTTFNNNTTNGTNSNHQYCSTYVSCSNGNHSSSPSSETSSSSSPSSSTPNSNSSLMMNWELLKDRGSGLVNLGNTCFINASLQCLANTPPLVQWLLCNSHFQCCRVKLEKQFCLFCEAERIVKLIHSKNTNSSFTSNVGAANPNNIVRRIKDISTTFKIGRQEDASEFLICLIDKIVDASLRSLQPPERLRPSSGTSYEQLCHSQTIFHDLFGLVLRSRVVCSRCRHTSDTFEVQYTWIVGVRNHTDLRQSLQQFVCRETLSGENLYRCIKCKQLVQAIKRYTLHKASKILLINLKRFEFGKNSHKLSHLVRYPEYLNVSPYMSEENSNDQSLNYRLYAVLVHVGSSMHSGHYFSYVRSPNNRWYKADDTTMTQCDLNQVLTQHGAYILCYIKETPLTNNTTNGSLITTTTTPTPSTTTTAITSKIVYQNGKLNNSEQQSTTNNNTFFTPRQIPVQNLSKQVNGQNGNMKTMSSSLTKPSIVSSNTESTNGGSALSTEKRAPIVMRIPKLNFLSTKPVPLQDKSITNPNIITPLSSKLVNKPNSNPIVLSTTKNSNYTISPSTSLSTVQSTSSPLKLIIKASGPSSTLNGLASISKSYNHYDDDDDDDDEDNDDSSDLQQPAIKKQRIDQSEISPSVSEHPSSSSIPIPIQTSISASLSSQTKSIDEQSNNSSSSTTKHKKKKKKKKSHKHHHHHHHHHHKNTHHHRKRSRRDSDRSQSRSPILSSPSQFNSSSPSLTTDDQYRRHRKRKKHHHKRYNSPSPSPSLRESL